MANDPARVGLTVLGHNCQVARTDVFDAALITDALEPHQEFAPLEVPQMALFRNCGPTVCCTGVNLLDMHHPIKGVQWSPSCE